MPNALSIFGLPIRLGSGMITLFCKQTARLHICFIWLGT
jgi:hypothetical protein